MNRNPLEHLIRAAAGNVDVRELVVIGSQSILGAFPNAPEDLLEPMTADVFPKDRPEQARLLGLSVVSDEGLDPGWGGAWDC